MFIYTNSALDIKLQIYTFLDSSKTY